MRESRIAFSLLVVAMLLGATGCSTNEIKETTSTSQTTSETSSVTSEPEAEVTELTLYRISDDKSSDTISANNEIQELITSRTNCIIREVDYIDSISSEEELAIMIENDNLPDLIYADNYFRAEQTSNSSLMGNEGLLIPWDEYIEKYPNIKELYTDEEWESLRQEDGHIYWANVSGNTYGEDKATMHYEYAFWIQARVLEWACYPEINTLDEYFDLLSRYALSNPTMPDGTEVIPYTVICDDWRLYFIESATFYLDGYYDCGMITVNEDNPENPYIVDCSVSKTAEYYFRKLNEIFNAGLMDEDFATQNFNEYIEKISSGRVLGMTDYYWNFAYSIGSDWEENGLKELGCDYVPLALTINEGQSSQYHLYTDYASTVIYSLAVTTQCSDPDSAFKFINDLLAQDMHDLRFWGIEGVDYLVDENGLYYRTEEMRDNWADPDYQQNHCCQYSLLPYWHGTSRDEINAMIPEEQPSEYYASLSAPLARCFEAYGATGYADMLHSDKDYCPGAWFPLYSDNILIHDEEADASLDAITECKHEWIPKVVIASDFEVAWEQYVSAYNDCNPQAYLDYAQALLDARMGKVV